MDANFNIYTGSLIYKGITFSYVFFSDELKLIPDIKDREVIEKQWLSRSLAPGVYVPSDPMIMDESFLEASCNETIFDIVFIPQRGSLISSFNHQLTIKIIAYIEKKSDANEFGRIAFSGPCLDHVYPVNKAYVQDFNQGELEEDGIISIKSQGFKATSTDNTIFKVDETEVAASFSIGWKASNKIGTPPLSFYSNLVFEFEPTSDYFFAYQLMRYTQKFLAYLTFQREVGRVDASLSYQRDDGKYLAFANMELTDSSAEFDETHLSKGRYIKVELLGGLENKILQGVVDDTLYVRHLPYSNKDKHAIDAAKFVLTTAAFEWEYKRLYPGGSPKSSKQEKGEANAFRLVQEAIDSSTGETKNALKYAQKWISSSNLESKIIHASKELEGLVGDFGEHMYTRNNEEFKYSSIGKRLANQRNDFGHGNIDKEFTDPALLDVVFLKYLVLAMQLRYYGISDTNIRKAINDLFGLSFAL